MEFIGHGLGGVFSGGQHMSTWRNTSALPRIGASKTHRCEPWGVGLRAGVSLTPNPKQARADQREDPPRPARTQKLVRKLTNSTTLQITADGLKNYPVRCVDHRPARLRIAGQQADD